MPNNFGGSQYDPDYNPCFKERTMTKKNETVRTWNNHGNTYLYSPATKKAIKRVAGRRGRPSYSEADVKKIPDNAEELAVADVSLQAQRALGLAE